jgi:hypothetical protein
MGNHPRVASPRDLANMVMFPFTSGPDMYTLNVPHDLEASNITLVKDSLPLQERDEEITLAGCRYYSNCPWSYSPSIHGTEFHIRVYLNRSLRTLAGYARLGSCNRPERINLTLSLPLGSTLPHVIMFDEWLGVIAVQYVNRSLGDHHDHVTIMRVGNLGHDAFDSNSRFLLQQFNFLESKLSSPGNREDEQRNAFNDEGMDEHNDIGQGQGSVNGGECNRSREEEESGESGKDVRVDEEDPDGEDGSREE